MIADEKGKHAVKRRNSRTQQSEARRERQAEVAKLEKARDA